MPKLDDETLRRIKTGLILLALGALTAWLAYHAGVEICFSVNGCPSFFRAMVVR